MAGTKLWKIGTRGSPLALAQAGWVRDSLAEKFPGTAFELCVIKTLGDKQGAIAAEQILSKGIFTREIEDALLEGKIDVAVHSLKDLPVELPPGLTLGPTPPREDPRDALVSLFKRPLAQLKKGAKVGTGSSRRKLQILLQRPDLNVVAIRGNVQTRVKRVVPGDLDAVVLAQSGLSRLGMQEKIAEVFEPQAMLPAVGQGALALEIREGDNDSLQLVAAIADRDADACAKAERAFLKALGGGCRVPIGGTAVCADGRLTLWGGVFDPAGTRCVRGELGGTPEQAEKIGKTLAEDLIARGAKEMLSHGG